MYIKAAHLHTSNIIRYSPLQQRWELQWKRRWFRNKPKDPCGRSRRRNHESKTKDLNMVESWRCRRRWSCRWKPRCFRNKPKNPHGRSRRNHNRKPKVERCKWTMSALWRSGVVSQKTRSGIWVPPVISELTHFHPLRQQVMAPVSNKAPRYKF